MYSKIKEFFSSLMQEFSRTPVDYVRPHMLGDLDDDDLFDFSHGSMSHLDRLPK